jgi:hypothetical protein
MSPDPRSCCVCSRTVPDEDMYLDTCGTCVPWDDATKARYRAEFRKAQR